MAPNAGNDFPACAGVLVHNPPVLGPCPLNAAERGMLVQLKAGEDVVVRSVDQARRLLDNTGLRPMNGETMNIAQPRLPGTYSGDLINLNNPTGLVHPSNAPPLHQMYPHYNLYFWDTTKSAIVIVPR